MKTSFFIPKKNLNFFSKRMNIIPKELPMDLEELIRRDVKPSFTKKMKEEPKILPVVVPKSSHETKIVEKINLLGLNIEEMKTNLEGIIDKVKKKNFKKKK